MTRIAWYTDHTISQKVMLAVQRGWKIPAKHTSIFRYDSLNRDEAILYGILRGCAEVMHYSFKKNVDYLHIDNGYINEGHFDGYYRFSYNSTQASYKNVNFPSDRADKLIYNIEDWKNNEGGQYLILPPTAAIAKFYGINIQKWLEDIKKRLGDRAVKVRQKTDSIPFLEDIKNAKCVLAFNSNGLLQATLAGVPAIALSNYSVIRNWNNLTLHDLDDCYAKSVKLDRQKLVNFCSYHQFTLDEVEGGLARKIINELREANAY